jgi:hypothetical protein
MDEVHSFGNIPLVILALYFNFRVVNDGNFGWRALRLLARRSPHFFTHSNNPINKLPEYLEMMIKRIAKDLPVSRRFSFKYWQYYTICVFHSPL